MYAGLADQFFKDDPSVIFFRFISSYIHKYEPKAIHFCWDSPKATIWRKKLYPEYKDGREHSSRFPGVDIEAILNRTSEICFKIVKRANCRNYVRERQEADDLIYAFCRLHRHQKVLIISSDGDFRQIPYMFNNVDLYNPLTNVMYQVEDVDPVEMRCFTGEKGDNIRGYFKVGKVTARALSLDFKKRKEFFDIRGMETYLLNRALIDLTLCPFVLHNMKYIQEVVAEDTTFDLEAIKEVIQKYKARGLMSELKRTILPFKFIGGKPKVEEVANADALCGDSAGEG